MWEKISHYQSIGTWKEVNILTQDFINLKNTNLLSFNYTALFDVLDVECPCVYNNVHGKLCNKCCMKECKGSSVIFGVDDTLIQSAAAVWDGDKTKWHNYKINGTDYVNIRVGASENKAIKKIDGEDAPSLHRAFRCGRRALFSAVRVNLLIYSIRRYC